MGSLVGGHLYDRFGNYTLAFQSAAFVAFAATLMVLVIRERPYVPPPAGGDGLGGSGGRRLSRRRLHHDIRDANHPDRVRRRRGHAHAEPAGGAHALDMTMRRELEEALTRLAGDAQVRVLIVRGAGEHFCAGATSS
mgnify:CR=1 FL=1